MMFFQYGAPRGVGSMRMRAVSVLAIVAAILVAEQASAQAWVSKMFAEKEHDFGAVARGVGHGLQVSGQKHL